MLSASDGAGRGGAAARTGMHAQQAPARSSVDSAAAAREHRSAQLIENTPLDPRSILDLVCSGSILRKCHSAIAFLKVSM